MSNLLSGTTLIIMLGIVLLLVILIAVLYLLRKQYLQRAKWRGDVCPKCSGDLFRVHRSNLDRFWGTLMGLPLRRYRCANKECGWSGLLYGKPHRHHPAEPAMEHAR